MFLTPSAKDNHYFIGKTSNYINGSDIPINRTLFIVPKSVRYLYNDVDTDKQIDDRNFSLLKNEGVLSRHLI